MNVTLAVVIALIAIAAVGAWYVALWRGWRHASRHQTPTERRVVISGIAFLMLLPVLLAEAGASDRQALVAIAVAMAVVIPILVSVGARDHRRRQDRIRARRQDASMAITEIAPSCGRIPRVRGPSLGHQPVMDSLRPTT